MWKYHVAHGLWSKTSVKGNATLNVISMFTLLDLEISGDQDVYVEPTFPTFPGVDSLSRLNGRWWAFQITVSRIHIINATKVEQHEALLNFGPNRIVGAAKCLNLSPKGDLKEAATNLYQMLHELDRPQFSCIAVAPIPAVRIGVAINDRLSRAAAGYRHPERWFWS